MRMMKPLAAGFFAVSLASGTALAAPITMTWDPAAAGLNSTVASITQNNQVISDFSTTVINAATGAFTDTGYLPITQFQFNGSPVASGGVGGAYSIYYEYVATGTFYAGGTPGFNPAVTDTAVFTGLTYSLIGTNGPVSVTFASTTANPTISPSTGTILATGSLSPSRGSVGNVTGDLPAAQVFATFDPAATESGFFIVPPSGGYIGLNLDAAFTNTNSVVTFTPSGGSEYLQVDGGGGNVNFVVPEPTSVALLSTGLLGLGLVMRRKKA